MKNLGTVIKTFSATKESSGLPRPLVSNLNLIEDYGIENDKFAGKKFTIGDSKIEITQVCTVCNHLNVFDKNLPDLLRSHRGLYCKIIKSGIIQKDMIVKG